MQTRTNSVALQLLEGVSGWTWIIASLLSVLFAISAIAFHGSWSRFFWSMAIAVVSKWLLRIFIATKQSVFQPTPSGAPSLSETVVTQLNAYANDRTSVNLESLAQGLVSLGLSADDLETVTHSGMSESESIAFIKSRRAEHALRSVEIRRKLSELGKLAGIESACRLSSSADLADQGRLLTELEAFAQENELHMSRAREMKALTAEWQELNPGSHDLDQLAEVCSEWFVKAAVEEINIAARRREIDPDGKRSDRDVGLLRIFDGAQSLKNNA